MSFFRTSRCPICKENKAHRFCLRKSKTICWECCSGMRSDKRCPHECEYCIRKNEDDDFQLKVKVDSLSEWQDATKRQIDFWFNNSSEIFEGKTPRQLSENEEGKEKLGAFFSNYHFNEFFPIEYLRKKINLSLNMIEKHDHHEKIIRDFLDCLISGDIEKTSLFWKDADKYSQVKFKENYLKRLKKHKSFSNVSSYFLISSGLSEDGKKGFVYLEFNQKQDVTFFVEFLEESWKVYEIIMGIPELHNAMTQVFFNIGDSIAKGLKEKAIENLKKYSPVYPFTADLNYYQGMHYLFEKKYKEAAEAFFDTYEIDRSFIEAIYHYALCRHLNNEVKEALETYREVIEKKPDHDKALTNLASLLIDSGDTVEAEKLLERALKINPEMEAARRNLERIRKK